MSDYANMLEKALLFDSLPPAQQEAAVKKRDEEAARQVAQVEAQQKAEAERQAYISQHGGEPPEGRGGHQTAGAAEPPHGTSGERAGPGRSRS